MRTALALCALLAACSSSSSGDARPTTPQTVNGTWIGQATSATGQVSTLQVTLTQTPGGSFTGTLSVTGSPCISRSSVTGSTDGFALTFDVSGFGRLEGRFGPDGTTVAGSYTISSGLCAGDAGNWSIRRQSAPTTAGDLVGSWAGVYVGQARTVSGAPFPIRGDLDIQIARGTGTSPLSATATLTGWPGGFVVSETIVPPPEPTGEVEIFVRNLTGRVLSSLNLTGTLSSSRARIGGTFEGYDTQHSLSGTWELIRQPNDPLPGPDVLVIYDDGTTQTGRLVR